MVSYGSPRASSFLEARTTVAVDFGSRYRGRQESHSSRTLSFPFAVILHVPATELSSSPFWTSASLTHRTLFFHFSSPELSLLSRSSFVRLSYRAVTPLTAGSIVSWPPLSAITFKSGSSIFVCGGYG